MRNQQRSVKLYERKRATGWRFFCGTVLVTACLLLSGVRVVVNPYADVDWAQVEQHQANLHTHTTQSDGRLTPNQVIDEYRKRGYTILCLTDHNLCTWPWTGFAGLERKGNAFMGDRAAERESLERDDGEKTDRRKARRAPPVPLYEDRDPAALGMLTMPGNEASMHHHTGVYFIAYETR
jgi:hypothetical protein